MRCEVISPQLIVALCVPAFLGSAVATASGKGQAPIKQEMGGLFVVTTELLPLVLDKASFEKKENRRKITAHIEKLKTLSSNMVTATDKFKDGDPSVRFISERFSEDMEYALDMWKQGDREVPRRLLRNVTDYCISCHTRTAKGAHFNDEFMPKALKSMPTVRRAEYLAATRQFSAAMKEFEKASGDIVFSKNDPTGWAQAVRKLLAITVRVEQSPSLTLEMLSRLQDDPRGIPDLLQAEVSQWRKSAKAWSEERGLVGPSTDQKITEIERLFNEGKKHDELVRSGGLVSYLRASTMIHEMLSTEKKSPRIQELYWLAGRAASELKEINFWTMQDIYFESCVRASGDKSLGKRCLDAFEESVVASYGSGSKSNLPEFMRRRIDVLKKHI